VHFPLNLFPWYLTVKYLYVFHCFIICAILHHYHSSWFNCTKTVGTSKGTVTVLLWDGIVTGLWVGHLRNCSICHRLALGSTQLLVWWVFGAPLEIKGLGCEADQGQLYLPLLWCATECKTERIKQKIVFLNVLLQLPSNAVHVTNVYTNVEQRYIYLSALNLFVWL